MAKTTSSRANRTASPSTTAVPTTSAWDGDEIVAGDRVRLDSKTAKLAAPAWSHDQWGEVQKVTGRRIAVGVTSGGHAGRVASARRDGVSARVRDNMYHETRYCSNCRKKTRHEGLQAPATGDDGGLLPVPVRCTECLHVPEATATEE